MIRRLFATLALLLASPLAAAPNSPFIVVPAPVAQPLGSTVDMETRCYVEGEPYSIYGNNFTAAVSVSTGAQNTTIVSATNPAVIPTIGKIAWLDSVTVSLDTIGGAQISLTQDSNTFWTQRVWQGILAANSPVVFPIHSFLRSFQTGSSGITLAVRNNLTAGSVSYKGAVAAQGCVLTDDLNLDAKYSALWIGDSVYNGTGPTATNKMLPFLIRDWYTSTYALDTRVILRSRSSTTSSNWETYRQLGAFDGLAPSVVWYEPGINDAGAAVSSSTYLANVTAFVTYARKKWPKAHVVVLGVGPLENNTSEASAVTYRSAASSYVSGLADGYVHFCDLGSSFDRTVSSNYVGTDTPGSRVHPNDTGHAAEAVVVEACITAQTILPGT